MSCGITKNCNNSIGEIEDLGFQEKNDYEIPENQKEKITQMTEELVQSNINTNKEYDNLIRELRRKYRVNPSKSQMLLIYNTILDEKYPMISPKLRRLMTKKACRTESGITQITSTMAPEWEIDVVDPITKIKTRTAKKFTCSFDCDFCPDERDETGKQTQPRSYLSREPAMLRASRMNFDAFKQFEVRAKTLLSNGHKVDKVEFIALGGTFNCYDSEYRERFIADTYHAANVLYSGEERDRLSLEEEIRINQTAKCGIIGLTLETRPDMINKQALIDFRRYNCTRVQIGIQSLNDEVLRINNRKCTVKDVRKAIRNLKGVGLKVVGHYMPDLPGSSPEIDEAMFDQAITEPNLQLDDWKIYPTAVVPYTKIQKKYESGEYMPYTEKDPNILIDMMIRLKPRIPKWVRIERLIRDIPTTYIDAGYQGLSNMRQIIHDKLDTMGLDCKCLRCKEVRNRTELIAKARLAVTTYQDDHGKEHFISYEACKCDICWNYYLFCIKQYFYGLLGQKIYWPGCKNYTACIGFCRLRLDCNPGLGIFKELEGCSLVRELHVYGQMIPVDNGHKIQAQHSGFGRKLMKTAEEISFSNGWKKQAVISGTGVRPYYEKKCGYHLEGTYMVKNLSQTTNYTQIYLNFIPVIFPLVILYLFNYHM